MFPVAVLGVVVEFGKVIFFKDPYHIRKIVAEGIFVQIRSGNPEDIPFVRGFEFPGKTVGFVEDDQTVAEYTVNYKKTHSQTLLPMLDEIVSMTEFDLDTIDAIAVAGGPGSFTGLRIGSATAKGLGLALNKPLIHVPTVDGMAYNLGEEILP